MYPIPLKTMTLTVHSWDQTCRDRLFLFLKQSRLLSAQVWNIKACVDSGVAVVSKNAGVVERVDADKVVVREDDGNLRTYNLTKFKRSNAGTCTNQRPIVEKGERIEAHQVIGDGPGTSNGELSPRKERSYRIYDMGRLQLRRRCSS